MTQASSPAVSSPTAASVLGCLATERLYDLCRVFGIDVRETDAMSTRRDWLVRKLAALLERRLPAILGELGRDELRAVARRHGLAAGSRVRGELIGLVLEAAGLDPRALTGRPPPHELLDGVPTKGQIVHARQRQWLVDGVVQAEADESPLVRLVCLDDDDPGRVLEILWDLELGARVVAPEAQGLGAPVKLDPPAWFGAYLHALKWSAVSAADATLFQAPFRAGIKLMAHQLTPLMKALELPRANLFVADDVGLGKTIEAGLVLQELLLRQQASFVLVVCPASVCLQWQGEMQRRFGLRFEVMTRELVAYRRQDRGFGTNPWSTHSRFIVSHSLLRRPEYRDALLAHLGERARKGLLILDEAHVAAPASASKYATDTEITRTIRDLAPRFDNRLFLSATPHNGHSNSFSALLEILDPVRFTRGVPVSGKTDLEPVMVRRLKRDLRALGVERFPRRLVVELALTHDGARFSVARRAFDAETGQREPETVTALDEAPALELVLAEKLARYTELAAPRAGAGRLPFLALQQRLLSSPEAFARTLEAHADGVARRARTKAERPRPVEAVADPDLFGPSEEAQDEAADAEVRRASAELAANAEARALLAEMETLADKARRVPDAKVRALLAWIRAHCCPAIGLGEDAKASRAWSDRRVLVFTEYADTKRWLVGLLSAAVAGTEDAEARIGQFHGGMGDEARDAIQRAFNAPPGEEKLRILIATDAAREGVNLQAHCADLFHFDIPWNPARLEQRNGRIDRTLQPADEVRCHYFLYPARTEDQVLATVIRKVDVVRRELGSLGAVLLDRLAATLAGGIDAKTAGAVEALGTGDDARAVAEELEAGRADLAALGAEIERAGKRLDGSRRALEVEPESLQGVVGVGLALAGAGPLAPAGTTGDGRPTFTLPELDRSWAPTLDTLRPPRGRDEAFYAWRERPPKPVTFHPLTRLEDSAEQLHLAHPLVRRILDRFLAQGFGAHDLARVTALVAPDESVARVVVYGRLTLFGHGAARLHDQLVPLAAAWSSDPAAIAPYTNRATFVAAIAKAERLLAQGAAAPNATVTARLLAQGDAVFRALWPHLEAEADALAAEARRGLAQRARKESGELRALLERQRTAIDGAEQRLKQGTLFEVEDREQKRQIELDLKHLERRRAEAARELETEPAAIEALYDVKMTRLTPVGLVIAWPEMMT